jgi:predicted small secreted protein
MKMRLGNTRSRRLRATDERHLRSRIASFFVVILAAFMLTACAEGTARDAKQGKQQDQIRTSVVNDIQATESAGFLLNPATPSPQPTK